MRKLQLIIVLIVFGLIFLDAKRQKIVQFNLKLKKQIPLEIIPLEMHQLDFRKFTLLDPQ